MEQLARNICAHIYPLELYLISMQRAAMSYGVIVILEETRDVQSESEQGQMESCP